MMTLKTLLAGSVGNMTVLFGLLVLSACGGGGESGGDGDGQSGSTSPSDTTAPIVTTATPIDGATEVELDTVIGAIFDEDILNTSVDETSLTLQNPDSDNISGVVTFDGLANEVTFTPDQSLALISTYTAVVTTGVTDLVGNPLAVDYSWQFTSRDGTWGTPQLVQTNSAGLSGALQVAFDADGNAMAVWARSEVVDAGSFRNDIWANRYTPSAGWEGAGLIETDNAGSADYARIAFDADGNALAIWIQSDGTRDNIWVNRYTPSTGWEAANMIETDNAGSAGAPQIAFDADGNAMAVWAQSDGTRDNIWVNRYIPGVGWEGAAMIETDNTGTADAPQITFDADGNALALWAQSDGVRDNIWVNRYIPGAGWEGAVMIETDNTGSAGTPQIAADADGNALAVWVQFDGVRDNVWANRYTLSAGWATAELIETDNTRSASRPRIAVDPDGNALVVWHQPAGLLTNIWSNRFTPATGWGVAELIATSNTGFSTGAEVAVDPRGNALAVWLLIDNTINGSVWANRFTPATGWSAAELITTDNTGLFASPDIAVDPDGNALAVWIESDGTNPEIRANRFD